MRRIFLSNNSNYKKIGLFGGSFNPPHFGHFGISKIALKKLKLDKIFWLIVPENPFKKGQMYLPLEVRIKLCKKLIKNNNKLEAIDFESDLKSFETCNTIKKAKRIFFHHELFWIMGGDSLLSFHKWKNPDFIAKNIKLVVFARGNMHKVVRTKAFLKYKPIIIWNKLFNISSTEMRKKLPEFITPNI